MNSLIHQDDVPVLRHMLKTFGYPEQKHHEEMIPFIHSILHHQGVRNQYLESLKFYHNNVDEEKGRKAIQRLGRTWNAVLQTGKRVSQLSDLPKEV
jgi:predicted helicase